MKLYEITNEYQLIFNNINEDGELEPQYIEKLDNLTEDFEKKAIAVASFIKNLEAEELSIANAIESMKKRKDSLAKKAQNLTDYLQFNLQILNIKEIDSSPYFRIKLKQCPVSVSVINELDIPQEYFKETIVKSLDKIRLKEVIKEGVEVPGVTLQQKIKLEIK